MLLAQAQDGSNEAREELFRRLVPRLERFAHGRIQSSLRSMSDTQEIVQETIFRAIPRLESFKPRHEGALMQYMKQILMNRIRDLSRRNRPVAPIEDENMLPSNPELSPIEKVVGEETLKSFESTLMKLKEDQRLAVMLHIEMGYSLSELAEALNRNSEAARKVLFRGLKNMAALMRNEKPAS
ncbi:MAG: sigma-70 family RNA polymerase sigma factor [Planctomycetota bacterium]